METVDVAVAIVMHEGAVLICLRPAAVHLGGYWEFPGGKIEPGESPGQCAVREVREEVRVEVRPERELPSVLYEYPDRRVRLHPILCRHVSGRASCQACDEARWVTPAELPTYRFPPANRLLLEQLLRELGEST